MTSFAILLLAIFFALLGYCIVELLVELEKRAELREARRYTKRRDNISRIIGGNK